MHKQTLRWTSLLDYEIFALKTAHTKIVGIFRKMRKMPFLEAYLKILCSRNTEVS